MQHNSIACVGFCMQRDPTCPGSNRRLTYAKRLLLFVGFCFCFVRCATESDLSVQVLHTQQILAASLAFCMQQNPTVILLLENSACPSNPVHLHATESNCQFGPLLVTGSSYTLVELLGFLLLLLLFCFVGGGGGGGYATQS